MFKHITLILTAGMTLLVPAVSTPGSNRAINTTASSLTQITLNNPAAYIPPQCYTKTRDSSGKVHNPCFTCHTDSRRPNFINDGDLQQTYDFPSPALTNHWNNLFKDRRRAVGEISDEDIQHYIHQSNYFDARGNIIPMMYLIDVPAGWDFNRNGKWDGFIPDARFNFDEQGFDRDAKGRLTGWRAFAYAPLPGSFWPTNGSTDDVLIRLPKIFRTNGHGKEDLSVYKTNLAIIEAVIREQDIAIEPVDEGVMGGVDLDKNGKIGIADHIAYNWAPLEKRYMWYAGKALEEQRGGKVHLAAGLFPEGTEFLHSVRYIDVNADGDNRLAPRMKELRYARKRYWVDYATLERDVQEELKEAHDFPNRLRVIRGNIETGVSNGQGWTYSAMIEDARGNLRPQTYEELAFCVGCHGGAGMTRDGIISFHRKFNQATAFHDGWYHWSQKSLRGTPDRLRADGEPEYGYYLQHNSAGDEFRHNREIKDRFFDAQGKAKPEMLNRLRKDISILLYASKKRALELNKTYRTIVAEQSFTQGRDPVLEPADNVYRQIATGEKTGIKTRLVNYPWNTD